MNHILGELCSRLLEIGESLLEMKDGDGFTLLHHAVLKCINGKCRFLFFFVREREKSSET